MKTIIAYDKGGKVLGVFTCQEDIKTAKCMVTDIPEGSVVYSVNVENPRKPLAVWNDPRTDEERKKEERISGIISRLRKGEKLRDVIGGMDLSSSEKWSLEAEVKKHGI